MHTYHKLWIVSATLVVAVLLVMGSVFAQQTPSVERPSSLVGASDEEVKQAALAYTAARFSVVGNEPEVVLLRSVTVADLQNLGLVEPGFRFPYEEPPLKLVIVKGDVDVQNMVSLRETQQPLRVQYIAYVYDLWAGLPTITTTSFVGEGLRQALNDPSLPENIQVQPAPDSATNTTPALPLPAAAPLREQLPYGSLAPTAAPQP